MITCKHHHPFAAVLSLAMLLAGCGGRQAAIQAHPPVRLRPAEQLRIDLDEIFSASEFAAAQWGVEVASLDRGEILYLRNPLSLYMPASNNKLVTTASALVRLGPEFRYETRVTLDGSVAEGVLKGNLIVTGAGDPSFAARFHDGDPFAVFRDWAARLKEMGISRIEGTIWGDGRAFPPPLVGQGWEWDDLPFGYAAPVSALQFNENLFTIEVTPGEAGGSPAMVNSGPVPDYVSIDARVSTAAAGTRGRIEVERGGRSDSVVVKGTIAADARPQTSTHAVERPSRYFAAALKKSLQDEGIDVTQAGIRTSDEPDSAAPTEGEILWSHCSAPLAEILKPLLKLSQNLYAETLARTLGLVLRDQGDFRAAREVVEETMEGMEVLKGTYAYVDGSGLSRHNLVSADMLVRILRYMRGHKDFSIFYDSLPIAGVDGTLRSRMSGTRAENNFRGKTGSINYARCVSGYLHTADGEMLAVAIIANNFLAPARTAEDAMDAALARLAEFHREEEPK